MNEVIKLLYGQGVAYSVLSNAGLIKDLSYDDWHKIIQKYYRPVEEYFSCADDNLVKADVTWYSLCKDLGNNKPLALASYFAIHSPSDEAELSKYQYLDLDLSKYSSAKEILSFAYGVELYNCTHESSLPRDKTTIISMIFTDKLSPTLATVYSKDFDNAVKLADIVNSSSGSLKQTLYFLKYISDWKGNPYE